MPGVRNRAIWSAVKGKCRNWMDEALPSAVVRSTSASGTAATVSPSKLKETVSSTPPRPARKAARRSGSSISNISVATSSLPPGTSGL